MSPTRPVGHDQSDPVRLPGPDDDVSDTHPIQLELFSSLPSSSPGLNREGTDLKRVIVRPRVSVGNDSTTLSPAPTPASFRRSQGRGRSDTPSYTFTYTRQGGEDGLVS